MRKLLKKILRAIYLEEITKDVIRSMIATRKSFVWRKSRNFGKLDSLLIKTYFSEHVIRKLHIGCGTNILTGWLNSDHFPQASSVLHLDATTQFPFDNDSLDYVFSEHMIEHVSYSSAIVMLNECNRVMKPGGRIRISTPNLQFLIDLYSQNKTDLQSQYIKWNIDQFVKYADGYEDTFVINNYVRDWGHQFIFDEKTLKHALEKTGFINVKRCDLSQSEDPHLRNLENVARMPGGFLSLETLTLEAEK